MRTRIVRMFSTVRCCDVLVVQKWMTQKEIDRVWKINRTRPGLNGETVDLGPNPIEAAWEGIRDFGLDEYDKASAFAMDLSLEKKGITELAVFESGQCTNPLTDPMAIASTHKTA